MKKEHVVTAIAVTTTFGALNHLRELRVAVNNGDAGYRASLSQSAIYLYEHVEVNHAARTGMRGA
ncbi:hypothetical protein [Caballeronia sp. BR00000012568055]|uniref:hypothetical protein n=1 Tax=Caballeronia sp. BR00000012568055 TaxID=2918761 RepID=UPI0023F8BA4C|nr:hypothetical protein [Caballeronia sp. BR00000012568055]